MLFVLMPVADLLVKQLMPERFHLPATIANFPMNLHSAFGVLSEVLTAEKEKGYKNSPVKISGSFFETPKKW
jgi:hypothetical protein